MTDDWVPAALVTVIIGAGVYYALSTQKASATPTPTPAPGPAIILSVPSVSLTQNPFGITIYSPQSEVVTGTGFTPSGSVQIFDEIGNLLATATASASGGVNASIPFNSYSPTAGTGYIYALDVSTAVASNQVAVKYTSSSVTPGPSPAPTPAAASISVSPASVGPTSWTVTVYGSNWGSLANNITLYLSPPLVGIINHVPTGVLGNFTQTITLPTTSTITSYTLYAKDLTSGVTSNQVSVAVSPTGTQPSVGTGLGQVPSGFVPGTGIKVNGYDFFYYTGNLLQLSQQQMNYVSGTPIYFAYNGYSKPGYYWFVGKNAITSEIITSSGMFALYNNAISPSAALSAPAGVPA